MIRVVVTVWAGFLAGMVAAAAYLSVSEPLESRVADALVGVVVFAAAAFTATLIVTAVLSWVGRDDAVVAQEMPTATAAAR